MRPGALAYGDAAAKAHAHLARIDAAMDALADHEEARIVWLSLSTQQRCEASDMDEDPPGSANQPDLQEEATAAIDAFDAESVEIVRALLIGSHT